MIRFRDIREYENLHIVMWLLKDTCWVLLWKELGLFMIVPTLAVAFHITWIRRQIKSELFHNLAVSCWITANSIWMIGEFFFDDQLRPLATVFFILGIAAVAIYYFLILPKERKAA
jgi:hypothetical protein